MEKAITRRWVRFIEGLHTLSQESKVKLFSVIAILFAIHLVLSCTLRDFTWLAAFGALLSIFGLLTSFSYSFPLEKINEKDLTPTEKDEHYTAGGVEFSEVVTNEEIINKCKQSKIDSLFERYKNISLYFIFTLCGTILWAYAGFLNFLFR